MNPRDDDLLAALAAADAALPPGPGATWSRPQLAALAARRTRRRLLGATAAAALLATGVWLTSVPAPPAIDGAALAAELAHLRDDLALARAGWSAAAERAEADDREAAAALTARLHRGAQRCDVATARAAALPAATVPDPPTKDHR